MKISLEHISKKFQRYWIFKELTYSFTSPGAYALLGANGSGKSTLMRVIAGIQNPSKGKVHFEVEGKTIEANSVFPYLSYCAPGMEIVEELTLREFLDFHFTFKKTLPASGYNSEGIDGHTARSGKNTGRMSVDEIIALSGLQDAADKPIADYSSGMKQRVKLAQAIFSDTPALLLDEPCTNLDQAGVVQYREWMETYAKNRLVIVASNDVREYFFCKEQIEVEQYK
jgi:ABC-type multidrug transport system ATPase subunit